MKATRLVPGILILVLFLTLLAGYRILDWTHAPVVNDSTPTESKIVLIPEGATFQQIAALLEHERLVKSRSAFVLLGKAKAADRRVHPGEYELNAAMSPDDILGRLLAGRVILHQVTIPEGYTMAQIAAVLEQEHVTDAKEFLRLSRDREFLASLDIHEQSLEGYLFPETYRFARDTKATDVIRTMVEALRQVWTPELQQQAAKMNVSLHDVLTLASVIEKETSVQDERELISAVFHNRLKRHIPLQSDPTVIYGLPDFDGNLRKKDLTSPSPYNTYRVQGLPPGPIANPGLHSIRATLFPAEAPYLYFVSRNDGTHHFSATLEEHNRAVDRYQRQPFRKSSARTVSRRGA